MKRGNGFTLAELLAVIVILGIVLVIAVPGVLGIINQTRRNAWSSSASVLVSTMKTDHQANGIKEKTEYSIKDNKIIRKTTTNVPGGEVPFEGKFEGTGEVTVDEKGKVIAAFSNAKWCASKTVKDTTLQVKDGACDLSIFDTTPPVIKQFVSTGSTSHSITVSLACEDPETRIIGYQFSKDGGKTYSDRVEDSIYTFDKLKSGSYQLRGKCINKAELSTESELIEKSTAEIGAPSYSINPSGDTWAQKKTVTITYPERQAGYLYEYSLDSGKTWIEIETGVTKEIEFTSPGTVIARISDGTNVKNASVYNVSKVDSTEPTDVSVTIGNRTSSTIQVTANGSDLESGISKYEFSMDGKAYVDNGTKKDYTFTKVTSGDHSIKVRVTNGSGMTVESGETPTAPLELTAPIYTVNPTGDTWASKKTVTITYSVRQPGYIYQYSLDSGKNWIDVTTGTSINIDFTSNGTVIARVYDGTNYKTGSSYSVGKVDPTAPTGVSVGIGNKTTNSIQVIASGSDSESGISKYEFSIDGGIYIDNGINNMYMFTKVTTGTHTIKIRLTNGSGLTTEVIASTTVNDIETPTYSISPSGDVWATEKTVTIIYPVRQTGFEYQYSTNGGTTWNTVESGTTQAVNFNSNGTIIARIYDGTNYKTASAYSVGKIDSSAPTGVSIGIGTKTTNTIQVTANGSDSETGITKYEFSIDGEAYINNGTTKYTFTKVTSGNHTIKIRLTNGVGLTTEASTTTAPAEITAPTYSISPSGDTWVPKKTVTITYPDRQTGFVYQYSINGGSSWNTVASGTTQTVDFTAEGTVIARIYDGTNYKTGSTYTVSKVGTDPACFIFDASNGTITDYNNECPDRVVIPSTIDGVGVTNIGNNAFESKKLIGVTIPDSVTTIGEKAFRDSQLLGVTIGNSVTTIGVNAFSYNYLGSVTIPDSVIGIGANAFYGNTLRSVTIGNSVTTIGANAFERNRLMSVMIPNSVTTIGEYAFESNNLTSVTIPPSVTSIGLAAFNDNQLPDSQAFIYNRNSDGSEDKTKIVSYGGAKRSGVVIPNGVITIGERTFWKCVITSVTIPNSVTTIGEYAFYDNQLTSVEIPDSVAAIEKMVFYENNLTSVTIGNSVTTIGENAFSWNQLTSVVIPESVKEIGKWTFTNNPLTSVIIKGKTSLSEFTYLGSYWYNGNTPTIIFEP